MITYLGMFRNTMHWNFSSWILGVRSVPSHCETHGKRNIEPTFHRMCATYLQYNNLFSLSNVCFAFKCHFKRRSPFSAFTLSFTVLTLGPTRPHVLINQVKGHATLSSLQDAVNDLLLQPRKMCHFLNVQTISGSDFSYSIIYFPPGKFLNQSIIKG